MKTAGFVIQPRLDFDNLRDKMLYQHFMESANYSESEHCNIGELITSITSLKNNTGWGYGVIRGILRRLEDQGLIKVQTRSQKRGIKITIIDYARLQSLKNYEKINKENDKPLTKHEQTKNKEKNKEKNPKRPSTSPVKACHKKTNNKENDKPLTNKKQTTNKENRNTITAFITSLNSINSNITLKDYLASSNAKSMNLSSDDDVKTFVDFALRTNALPSGVSSKVLTAYIDCIRLTRQTCTISANLLANLFERMSRYSVDQLNYALWIHVDQHDDKKEQYTLGILRNTNDPEARRGLIKLKNKNGGVGIEIDSNNDEKYDYGF